jgi:anti-anti-sigma factor
MGRIAALAIPGVLEGHADRGGGRAMLVLSGELDRGGAGLVGRAVATLLAEPTPRLVIDLRDLTFIDLAGVRELLAARTRAGARAMGMSVLVRPGAVLRLLRLLESEERLGVRTVPRAA